MSMLHTSKRGNYTNVQWAHLVLSTRTLFDKSQEKSEERDDAVSPNSEK